MPVFVAIRHFVSQAFQGYVVIYIHFFGGENDILPIYYETLPTGYNAARPSCSTCSSDQASLV